MAPAAGGADDAGGSMGDLLEMERPENGMMTVEAELCVPAGTVQLVHFLFLEPISGAMREEGEYRLDLCLTPRPRNARACYTERWAPHRFERIGPVFLLPPGETLQARSDGGRRQRSLVCHLRSEAMRTWLQRDLEWTDRRLAAILDIPDANIRGLLLRLAEEVRHPGFASDALVELICAQIAIELGRYCAGVNEGPATGGLAPWRLRLIEERLRDVQGSPTLAELADLCKLSVRQLTRGFRVSRGCSIGDHLAHSRLNHAKRMLATDESVKAIAYSLGFSSPSSFSYAFRRLLGETPRQFRQRALSTG
jgi:AraC family transcriptional regulator